MKNGLLIWNVVLTLVAGYLLVAHFRSGKSKNGPPTKTVYRDTASSSDPGFRIAYIEMDSIENHFQMVKDVQAEISKKERDYNNDLARLDYTYKTRYEGYQQKAATMSKDDYEKAKIDLKQLEDQLKRQKQDIDQDYQEYIMHRQLDLKTTITNFLAEYNKTKRYSYIIVYERDFLYYKDTSYNITADVIKGLNEEYRAKKKAG